MSLKELDLKVSYDSSIDNILEEFYIPVLKNVKYYDRIAGYFTSSSLAVAAKGMVEFVENKGKVRIITSPNLNKNDVVVMNKAIEDPKYYLEKKMLEDLRLNVTDFENDCLGILGYLLAKNILEIKVVIPLDEYGEYIGNEKLMNQGLFHQKVGILKDDNGDGITFSGSINETSSAWTKNIEEFKVFKSWERSQQAYYEADTKKFDLYWNGMSKSFKVIDLPIAIRDQLIKKSLSLDKLERLSLKKYLKKKEQSISLFYYQKEAIEKWEKNNYQLMLEMATGTGKTRTALGAILEFQKKENKSMVVVATPQNTLSMQWKKEAHKLKILFDKEIIADSTNPKWREELEISMLDLKLGIIKKICVFTTHSTSSNKIFIDIIKNNIKEIPIFFIGDEVHGLGATKTKKSLLMNYQYRLGLSATPKRWFDDEGTEIIYNYFGNENYSFDIERALNEINPLTGKTYLVNYNYYPSFVSLTDFELEEYIELTGKIVKASYFDKNDKNSNLENLIFKRSNIIKNAENKIEVLRGILEKEKDLKDTLIFTSPEKIDQIGELLYDKNIKFNKITQETKKNQEKKLGNKSEREYVISQFIAKRYDVLLAIRCLDEGIDIPTANRAILVSSSTNPREYIQRIGRVIRQSENKHKAEIYDLIVVPNKEKIPKEYREVEKKIFQKEMNRILEICRNSLNGPSTIIQIMKKFRGE